MCKDDDSVEQIQPARVELAYRCKLAPEKPHKDRKRVQMHPLITALINYLTPAAAGILLCAAIACAAAAYQKFLQGLPDNMRTQVANLADTVTNAIEQKYLGQNPGGALKKQEAMQMLSAICKALGLTLNENHASAAIESAVYAMNLYHRFRQSATSPHQETQALPIPRITGS